MQATGATVSRPVPRLTDPWALGGVEIANRVVLAPLAGIGNWFVRLQAKRFGAGLVVSEMVSSFGLAHGNERTVREFLRIHPDEHPVSMQLFGHDPDVMREAAAMVADAGADLIDLNMGCPVRKVCKTGAGAALLDDPDRAIAIARAAREGGGLPVTVKLRPGERPGDRDGVVLARRLVEEAGVAGIAFHPRHASQQHSGHAGLRPGARARRGAARAGDPLRRAVLGRDAHGAHSRRAAPPRSCSRAARSAIRGASPACSGAMRANRRRRKWPTSSNG